jgi:hypothetical protein
MQIVVRADDGDQITVNVDDLASEQGVIRLDLHNPVFGEIDDFESIALTLEHARELAIAILSIADVLDGGSANNRGLTTPARRTDYLRLV